MQRDVCVFLCVWLALAGVNAAAQCRAPRFSNPAPSEWVHIDGSRNPELIPQWSIWQRGLQILARGRALTTVILERFTREDIEILKHESAEELKRDGVCQQRVLKLAPLLASEPARVLDGKTKAIQLECRQDTLEARDRLLARLAPDAQIALTEWIEALKAGTRVSVPKQELAHYLKPQ